MARSMGLRLTNRLRILWLRTCEFLKCIAWMCLLVKRHRVLYSTILTLLWTLFVYLSVSNVSANLHSISYHISIFITFKRNSTLQDMLILLLSVNLYVWMFVCLYINVCQQVLIFIWFLLINIQLLREHCWNLTMWRSFSLKSLRT